jgi:hypothetical protein
MTLYAAVKRLGFCDGVAVDVMLLWWRLWRVEDWGGAAFVVAVVVVVPPTAETERRAAAAPLTHLLVAALVLADCTTRAMILALVSVFVLWFRRRCFQSGCGWGVRLPLIRQNHVSPYITPKHSLE